uniref:Uncharacterized protein n=1 Tax=Kalanchoe fedtschenkoi TaxID=63787 RepID=A0A7N0T196_KALFE
MRMSGRKELFKNTPPSTSTMTMLIRCHLLTQLPRGGLFKGVACNENRRVASTGKGALRADFGHHWQPYNFDWPLPTFH